MSNSSLRTKTESRIFDTVNVVLMLLLAVATLYPFLNTLAISFNQGSDTIKGGIYLWPRIWTLKNYQSVFASGHIIHAFGVSVARTVISTVLNIFLTTMVAYALSRKEYIFRKFITTAFVLTMYFNAGLIPGYFLIKDLGLINNFLVYIVPSLINAFNLIVIRTYIGTIPESLVESARIDGASDFRIFFQIIFPLCKPVLATIALFVAVGAWNSWFDTLLYASSKQNLSTLQFELMKLLSSTMAQNSSAAVSGGSSVAKTMAANLVTPLSIRAAVTIVAATPILLVYPFLQKHFVVGLNVGSVKE